MKISAGNCFHVYHDAPSKFPKCEFFLRAHLAARIGILVANHIIRNKAMIWCNREKKLTIYDCFLDFWSVWCVFEKCYRVFNVSATIRATHDIQLIYTVSETNTYFSLVESMQSNVLLHYIQGKRDIY